MKMPKTRSLPSALTASAHETELSIPPDSPTTKPRRRMRPSAARSAALIFPTSAAASSSSVFLENMPSAALPRQVGAETGHGVEVLGHHLDVLDGHVKRLLEEGDHLEHARRIDDPGLEQRHVIGERGRIGNVEVSEEELPNLVSDLHLPLSSSSRAQPR